MHLDPFHIIALLSIIYTYTTVTVDNEAYVVYVCALSSTVESHTVVQSFTRSHGLVGVYNVVLSS